MMTEQTKNTVIQDLQKLVIDIANSIATIHQGITYGEIGYTLYSDYFEVANYQLAQVESVIQLANGRSYREAFIILRTLFEHMLLFRLMTVADKYFILFKKNRNESDATAIARLNSEIQTAKQQGKKTSALRAVNYSRDGVVAVIYQGPYVDGEKKKGNLVPYYLSLFNQFNPTAAFLDDGEYFDYLPSSFRAAERNSRNANTQRENKYIYTHYLSFTGMLKSLEINKMYSKKEITRIKAHYNFLSEFTHPTKGSMSVLKARNHQNSHIQNFDEIREHKPTLCLLASLYLGNIVASIGGDLLNVLVNAPKKHFKSVNSDLDTKLKKFYTSTDYFWFIDNGPHSYDKFIYCIHHADNKKLNGNYELIDSSKVIFKKEILERLTSLQGGWSNQVWGTYKPPFTLI